MAEFMKTCDIMICPTLACVVPENAPATHDPQGFCFVASDYSCQSVFSCHCLISENGFFGPPCLIINLPSFHDYFGFACSLLRWNHGKELKPRFGNGDTIFDLCERSSKASRGSPRLKSQTVRLCRFKGKLNPIAEIESARREIGSQREIESGKFDRWSDTEKLCRPWSKPRFARRSSPQQNTCMATERKTDIGDACVTVVGGRCG